MPVKLLIHIIYQIWKKIKSFLVLLQIKCYTIVIVSKYRFEMCFSVQKNSVKRKRSDILTKFLVRLFVKNYENYQDSKVRTSYGVLASMIGIVCNLILFIAKIIIGFLINSISVTADAFNNLSDSASSLIGLFGVKLASRPADKEHPFGHGRYEYVAALFVAFLILQVGLSCLKSSVGKIFHPEATSFDIIAIIILVLSVLLKVWLSMFNKSLGKKISSSVMKATAADALGDVLITSATILSLLIGHFTKLQIDGFMGTAVSVFVLLSGFNIAKDTLEPLLGEAVDKETFQRITQKVMSYPNIVGTHDLIVHNYGPSHTMATIHCEVPNDIAIEEAHEVIDQIERDVLREMNIFLVIHMDPIEIADEIVNQTRSKVAKIVRSIDEYATIHDFRMVNGEHQINLIFDLVVPHHYKEKEQQDLSLRVMEKIREVDQRYQCVITVESSFVDLSK